MIRILTGSRRLSCSAFISGKQAHRSDQVSVRLNSDLLPAVQSEGPRTDTRTSVLAPNQFPMWKDQSSRNKSGSGAVNQSQKSNTLSTEYAFLVPETSFPAALSPDSTESPILFSEPTLSNSVQNDLSNELMKMITDIKLDAVSQDVQMPHFERLFTDYDTVTDHPNGILGYFFFFFFFPKRLIILYICTVFQGVLCVFYLCGWTTYSR